MPLFEGLLASLVTVAAVDLVRACSKPVTELDNAIEDPYNIIFEPNTSLRNCQKMLRILEQEFDGAAGALLATSYDEAFQVAIIHEDQARASVFANRAYEARIICQGKDSPETIRMKGLALKPASHPDFAKGSTRWRTSIKAVPKGLDSEQFEKWLFREGR